MSEMSNNVHIFGPAVVKPEHKEIFDKILEDYNSKIESIDEILSGSDFDDNDREQSLRKIIDMIELLKDHKYLLDCGASPIDLNSIILKDEVVLDQEDSFITETLGYYLLTETFEAGNDTKKRLRDVYYQYWLIHKDNVYLEQVLNLTIEFLTTEMIMFLVDRLYSDEDDFIPKIKIGNTRYDMEAFYKLAHGNDIISNLGIFSDVFNKIYEAFEETVYYYNTHDDYRDVSEEDIFNDAHTVDFVDDNGSMVYTREYTISNLYIILNEFYYIRAIIKKLEHIYEYEQADADIKFKLRRFLRDIDYGFKNLVNCYYKTSDYLTDEIDIQEFKKAIYGTVTRLYDVLDYVKLLNKKDKVTKDDLNALFEMKQHAAFAKLASPVKKIDILINSLMDETINLISKKSDFDNEDLDFDSLCNKLTKELGDKYKYVEGSSFKSLSTAEYLYELFINNKNGMDPNKDYSCISILYYKALEDALNKIIYVPYYNAELKPIYKIQNWENKANTEIILDRLPGEEKALYKIKNSYYHENRSTGCWELANRLMIGNLGFLLKERTLPKALYSFLGKIMTGDIKLNCNILSNGLLNVKDNRNNAAHGGNIINYQKVTDDKRDVFTLEQIGEYKRLLLQLLNMLK